MDPSARCLKGFVVSFTFSSIQLDLIQPTFTVVFSLEVCVTICFIFVFCHDQMFG